MPLNIGGFNLGINMPSINTSGIGYWITIISIILIILMIGGIAIYIYFQRKLFNKKIIDFENISGQGYQPTFQDTARLIKVGDGGEEILFLRKRKQYRTAYGRKMGVNTYWFSKGQDGYWYNVLLGDLDAKMGMLDIEPIDRDMRYMHVAIRKNIQERYRKVGFMEKYGQVLMSGIFLLIMIIAVWLLMSKAGDLITVAQSTVESSKPVADSLKVAVSKLDSICGASGIRPSWFGKYLQYVLHYFS